MPPSGGVLALTINPLAWYDVLYVGGANLANPSDGYPITGSSQMHLNTCYKTTNYPSIVAWLGYNVGTPTDAFTNSSTGLLAQSNVGALPTPWARAINQTFLTNSTESSGGTTLGSLNLWIQPAGSTHCSTVGTVPAAGGQPAETAPGI